MSTTDKPKTSVITGTVVLSYPHVDKPQIETDDDGKPTGKSKFSGAFIFLPDYVGADGKPGLHAERAAIIAAAEAAYPGKGTDMIRTGALKNPLRIDAEAKGYPVGSTFVNARTERKPGAVYSWPDPTTGKAMQIPAEKVKEELYAGARVRVSLTAFAYNKKGNKGISFALNNIQKVGDGERIDGRVAAENEFTADLSQAPADFGTATA